MVPLLHVYGYVVILFKVHLPIRTVFGFAQQLKEMTYLPMTTAYTLITVHQWYHITQCS